MAPVGQQVEELPRADRSKRGPPRSFRFDAAPVYLPPSILSPQTHRLRVLAFAPPRDATTLIALGRRFDLDLTLPYVPEVAATQVLYPMSLGDRFEGIPNSELVDSWKAALAVSALYDVILLQVDSVGVFLPRTCRRRSSNASRREQA